MVQFNEANSVRDFVRDLVTSIDVQFVPGHELPRRTDEVILEGAIKDALIRLNPEIEAEPDKADEVIYNLRAILIAARTSPHPVVANEEFMAWLTGQKSMPFGPNGEHTTVRLIDFAHPEDDSSNQWMISTEVTYEQGRVEKRFDLVLWCNGFPLVVGEAKTPVRAAYTWIDGAAQIHDDYEQNVPQFFVPNVFSFATEGKDFRYGSIGMPIELWGPWRDEETGPTLRPRSGFRSEGGCRRCPQARGRARLPPLLHGLRHRQEAPQDQDHCPLPAVPGDQPDRRAGGARLAQEGPDLALPGLGQVAADGVRRAEAACMPGLGNPDGHHRGRPHRPRHPDHRHVQRLRRPKPGLRRLPRRTAGAARAGCRKIIITTIHKFGEAAGVLNERDNIIVMVDEAHRTQEGDFGRKMREALPNAFLFGLTGTPINRRDRNTF